MDSGAFAIDQAVDRWPQVFPTERKHEFMSGYLSFTTYDEVDQLHFGQDSVILVGREETTGADLRPWHCCLHSSRKSRGAGQRGRVDGQPDELRLEADERLVIKLLFRTSHQDDIMSMRPKVGGDRTQTDLVLKDISRIIEDGG